MHVAEILRQKGRAVETVRTDVSLLDVVKTLAAKRIGAVVVTSRDQAVAGIVSERDIMRALGKAGADALDWPVTDVMTTNVVTCREIDTIDTLMSLMTTHRFRHLPVVEGGELVGLVSIGDVVKHRVAEVELEATAMRDYITTS